MATKYIRPEATAEDKRKAEETAKRMVRRYGLSNLPKMLAALVLENVSLVNEINEHRAARGFELLETHEE